MKKNLFGIVAVALATLLIFSTSCKKKGEEKKLEGNQRILLATAIKNPDGASGKALLQQISKLEGDVDVSKGVSIGFGATLSVIGNDIFVFPEFGIGGKQAITKFVSNKEGIQETGKIQVAPYANALSLFKITEDKYYIANYMLGTLSILNPKTLKIEGEIDLRQYAHTDTSPEPAIGILRDGLFYIALDQIGPNWMPYSDYLQTDIAIIDPKTDKVVKVVSDKESILFFPTRPMYNGMAFVTEQGDLYFACAGFFGFNPEVRNNGFVCIPKGKQEFDATMSWDVKDTPIEGLNSDYKSATIANTLYIGDNKVVAYVGIPGIDDDDNPYTTRSAVAVLMDLSAKTIKRIEGIPPSSPYSTTMTSHKGKIYLSAFGKKEAGIYEFNPKTEQTKRVMNSSADTWFLHFFKD